MIDGSCFDDAAFATAFLGFWLVYAIICLVIYIPWIIGAWKVLTKAGEKGWKAIIPIYNTIVLLKIAGLSPWWVLGTFVNPLNIFVSFYRNIKLAEKFGKGAGYGVLMAFFEPIMYLVLGFGSAEYNGSSPTEPVKPAETEENMAKLDAYNKAYAEYEKQVAAYNEQVAKKS
ncbi:MAG: DUF5684 domain-containing protein [Candidatus Nomurabacteria bacterium]|jgi:hypothetical protein|nr:DUF5684 domain-containing protein [Candidatus Nomurabacteria bacterium]